MRSIKIQTKTVTELIDITQEIQSLITASKIQDGIVLIHIPHTTAAITINENTDPDVVRDLLMKINEVIDDDRRFRHSEGNSDAHIKSSLFGPSLSLIISEGVLQLGSWQGIYFCEFDGPRTRQIWVKIMHG